MKYILLLLGEMLCQCPLGQVNSVDSIQVLYNFLIFCEFVLPITEKRFVKSPAVTVNVSIFLLKFYHFFSMYLKIVCKGITFRIAVS